MAYLPTKDWLDFCVDSLDLPGSPWHAAKRDVLKRLAKKLEEKHLVDESQQVSYELEDRISVLPGESHEKKRIREKAGMKQKMIKAFFSIAAREAGYSANADRSNQTQTCTKLISYIQNILKVNYEVLLGPNASANSQRSVLDVGDKSVVEHNDEIKLLGTVLSQILENDPRQLYKISLRLKDRIIPDTLRKSFYQLTLQRMAEDKYGVTKRDEVLRQEFAGKVKSGMTKLGIKDPTKSPVQHLIQTTIIESYETLPSLTRFSKDMKFQKSSSTILNILYTSTQKFKYEYILWLFPLHVAAQDNSSKEHMFELAMQLDRFTRYCFELSNTNKISLDVWRHLMDSRIERIEKVIQHFENIGVDMSIDKVQLILEKDMGSTTENAAYHSDIFKQGVRKFNLLNNDIHKMSLFAVPHPILCIRQWIRYLFVGSTSFSIIMFLFDQFFLHFWDHEAIVKACLSLISLLFDSLIESTTVEGTCTVMLMETNRVKASDFQVMWKYVARHYNL